METNSTQTIQTLYGRLWQAHDGPTLYMFAGTDGSLRLKIGDKPNSANDGSDISSAIRRSRKLLSQDDSEDLDHSSGANQHGNSSATFEENTTSLQVLCSTAKSEASEARLALQGTAAELKEIRDDYLRLDAVVRKLRSKLCSLSPHDEVLCGGGQRDPAEFQSSSRE